jgi:hypothetical protein
VQQVGDIVIKLIDVVSMDVSVQVCRDLCETKRVQ